MKQFNLNIDIISVFPANVMEKCPPPKKKMQNYIFSRFKDTYILDFEKKRSFHQRWGKINHVYLKSKMLSPAGQHISSNVTICCKSFGSLSKSVNTEGFETFKNKPFQFRCQYKWFFVWTYKEVFFLQSKQTS